MIACRFLNADGTLGERFFVPSVIHDYPPDNEMAIEENETAALLAGLDGLLENWDQLDNSK